MKKKTVISLLLIGMALALAACSGSQLPAASQSSTTPGGSDSANMSLEAKLAIGTFKLEGTDLAVSAEEAQALLPLWKAVKSLGASATASPEEIRALYQQIQETMSPAQIDAIDQMSLSTEEINTLMKDLGIEGRGFAGQGASASQNFSEVERSTRVAQFQSQNPGGIAGGEPGLMMMPREGGAGVPGQGSVQQTPSAGQITARRSLGMNYWFLDPLIQLLTERANS